MAKQNIVHFPYEIKELEPDGKEEMTELFEAPKDFVSIGPKEYKVLRPYLADAANIYNMPVRDSDVFVMSYQRSGTTWVQELVWQVANNFDYATAEKEMLTARYHFLEMFMFYNKQWQEDFLKNSEDKEGALGLIAKLTMPISKYLLTVPSPRFIKTHLPLSLLPPKLLDTAKVVYIARDPRDIIVSSYFHSRLFQVLNFPKPIKDFWTLFSKNLFTLTPIFEHVKEAWEKRDHPNMLFLFYEELSKDMPASVRRVADFLGKEVTTEQMLKLCDHLNIENFKNNKSVNFEDIREFGILEASETFIRTGKTGGWRNHFDEEMTQQAEKWIEENLRGTDLRYPSMSTT